MIKFYWHPLDPFGFGRLGYEKASKHFAPLNPGNPQINIAITGANSGLGFALTQQLAKSGCTVYMLCRNQEKGDEARNRILPNDKVFVFKLDVSSLKDINSLSSLPQIDILVQNAGMMADNYVETEEGWESTVATHLIGPYVLKTKLKPKRCIWVTSGGAYMSNLNVNDVFHPPKGKDFDGATAYSRCKRAQISLARIIGDDVMHPGWAETPGVQHSLPKFHNWTKNYLRTPEQGIDTILWLVLNPPEKRNFWFDRSAVSEHKWFARTRSSSEEESKLKMELDKFIEDNGT